MFLLILILVQKNNTIDQGSIFGRIFKMKIDNSDFNWQDPDLHSCEPHFTFPTDVADSEMRRDSFPQFSDEGRWALAMRDLGLFFEREKKKSS
jgi:hypothetical protein